jgi:Holliday junction resolvasome RuvABC DNA-binding subunit
MVGGARTYGFQKRDEKRQFLVVEVHGVGLGCG